MSLNGVFWFKAWFPAGAVSSQFPIILPCVKTPAILPVFSGKGCHGRRRSAVLPKCQGFQKKLTGRNTGEPGYGCFDGEYDFGHPAIDRMSAQTIQNSCPKILALGRLHYRWF
jgi:hypothetical protein